MSAVNQFETDLNELIFNNVALTLIGNAGGLLPSTVAGSLYISLHTAALADTDTSQLTSESAYTNYARVAVARSGAGWTCAGANVSNAAAVTFPQCGATGSTILGFGIGTADTGAAGYLMFKGTLTYTAANGNTPSFAIGALDIDID